MKYFLILIAFLFFTKTILAESKSNVIWPQMYVDPNYGELKKDILLRWNNAFKNYEVEQQRCDDIHFADATNPTMLPDNAQCIIDYVIYEVKKNDINYKDVNDALRYYSERMFEAYKQLQIVLTKYRYASGKSETERLEKAYDDLSAKVSKTNTELLEYMGDALYKVATSEQEAINQLAATIAENERIIEEYSNEDKFDPQEILEAASGTGFFINNKGFIVTNSHVVEGCEQMTFLRDSKEFPATVIATDSVNDIALLSSEINNNKYFKIRQNDVERAENIKAIGYGFGKVYSSDIKVTAGIVSSLAGYADNYSEFQMDAAIQSGNSGGPVVDENVNVVGISVAVLDSLGVFEDTGTLPQNVNYAIKGSTLKQFLDANKVRYDIGSNSFFSSLFSSDLNDIIDEATVYLSCYMTYAQIKENSTQKVLFENIN